MTETVLNGCAPEPLISYLKAIGVLRTIAEDPVHGDAQARGYWRDDIFVLRSRLSPDGLVAFFLQEYRPTPILVPWSGGDFFDVNRNGDQGPYTKAPTSTRIIEAFLASSSDRLAHYRRAIIQVLDTMEEEGITSKGVIEGSKGKEAKSRFLAALRSRVSDDVVRWIDAAAVMESDRAAFNVLLGSGGGSDGNSHYSDNFMQHLWDALPEFADQGSSRAHEAYIRNTLFGVPVRGLTDRTPSLFSSGAIGGPNSSEGFGGDSLLNSWDFILALEGALCFAGAVVRKLSANPGNSSFPFSVMLSAAGYGTAVEKEAGQREIWLPLWRRPLCLGELLLVFSEGRAQTGRRASRTGADFARALASFGVDAGIDSFRRFAFVKGRVGGENYTTAVPIGRFEVLERNGAALLLEIDGWLETFRQACRGDNTPPRFLSALRRIESAIVDYSRYGGNSHMAGIVRALGNAERELANAERFRNNDQRTIPPIPTLSATWLAASDDGSPEFRLAAALGGVYGDTKAGVGDIRENLEPARRDRERWTWGAGESVAWTGASVETNLVSLLSRVLMESNRANLPHPALSSRYCARHVDIAAFLWKETDDNLFSELLWGLILVDRMPRHSWSIRSLPITAGSPLPRLYAALKLPFLAGPLNWQNNDYDIWPEPAIPARLQGLDIPGAVRLALRRLRAAGLRPCIGDSEVAGSIEPRRMAAALIFPVANESGLAALVIRKPQLEGPDLMEEKMEIEHDSVS